ncbi:F-box/LRR-repeat protein 2-like [Periplaneta americana]|uniref:F-box/LRR-repeat protein 2-like n=1 Tax=Periplaneta americana TaxID=6978 RepID=UPI0037E6FE8A
MKKKPYWSRKEKHMVQENFNGSDVDELVRQLCWTNHEVESVTIKRCSRGFDSRQWLLLRAPVLNRLLHCCPLIRHLELSEVNIRSGKFFRNLGHLQCLKSLQLSYGHFLMPSYVRDVATQCTHLTRLWLSGENCSGSSDAWQNAYTMLFSHRCNTLTHLKFDASKLTDSDFKGLAQCVNLHMLHLHKATHLDEQGLQAIGSLRCLLSLRLHNVRHLCFDSLVDLFRTDNLRGLVDLSLADCSCVNDMCAEAIAKHCRHLHTLSLALVNGVTDNGVETIVRRCDALHYLDLYCMRSLTGVAFAAIALHARELSFLVLEQPCDRKKEERVGELNATVKVHRTPVWRTGGTHICRLLSCSAYNCRL